jgi:hypothetical protein
LAPGAPGRAVAAAGRGAAASLLLVVVEARARQHGAAAGAVADDLAVEHPDLDADDAVGRLGLGGAVLDVGAQGLQRHAAVGVPLGAGLLGAAEATGAADLDAAGARLHRALDGLLHGAAEGEAALELLGDALRDQGRDDVGVADLLHVDGDGAVDDAVELRAQRLDRLAAAADDDARLGGEDRDVDVVGGALDVDAGDPRPADVTGDGGADGLVLLQQLRVRLGAGVPAGRGGLVDAEAEAQRVDLVTHGVPPG